MKKQIDEAKYCVKETIDDFYNMSEAMDNLSENLEVMNRTIDTYNESKNYCESLLREVLHKLR